MIDDKVAPLLNGIALISAVLTRGVIALKGSDGLVPIFETNS